jgi:hypothetical protein
MIGLADKNDKITLTEADLQLILLHLRLPY